MLLEKCRRPIETNSGNHTNTGALGDDALTTRAVQAMVLLPADKLFQHGLVRLRVGDWNFPGPFRGPPRHSIIRFRVSRLPLHFGAGRSFPRHCIHGSAVAKAFRSQYLDPFVILPCVDGIECSGMHIILVRHRLKGDLLICCDQYIRQVPVFLVGHAVSTKIVTSAPVSEDRTQSSHVATKNELYLHWTVLPLSIPLAHCLLFKLGHLAKCLCLAKKSL